MLNSLRGADLSRAAAARNRETTEEEFAQRVLRGAGGFVPFVDEHGVLKIGGPSRLLGRKYKRRYYLLCIPESALRRVEQRLMDKRPAEPVSFFVIEVLPQFRCSGEPRDIGSNRARKSSKPARPYIWRLSVFSRLM